MRQIDLSAGTMEYEDTGGDWPVLVLLHGLMMDASLWDGVIADLSADHRCVVPTLPLGAHRHAMRADADLSRSRNMHQINSRGWISIGGIMSEEKIACSPFNDTPG